MPGLAHLWVPGDPVSPDSFYTRVADHRGQSGEARARIPEVPWSYIKAVLGGVWVPGYGNPYEHEGHGQATTANFIRDALVHRIAELEQYGWVKKQPESRGFGLYLMAEHAYRDRRERATWEGMLENWGAELADLQQAGQWDEAAEMLEEIEEDARGLPERFREATRTWLRDRWVPVAKARSNQADVRHIGGLTRGAGESTVRGARRGGRVARPAG